MILRKIFATACVAALCAATHAASLPVGYSYGEIAATGQSKVGKATISGAIMLPADKLERFKGAKIAGVRVGLVIADGVSELRGWVRPSLEGENLDESASAAAEAGWNTLPLNGDVLIDGRPLAVGFSFQQNQSVKCISIVGENNDDARWIAKNDKWELARKEGVLSVELIVEGDDVPASDLEIASVRSCDMPVKAGEDLTFDVTVRNVGFESIPAYAVGYGIIGSEMYSTLTVEDDPLAYGETATLAVTVPSDRVTPDIVSYLDISATSPADGYDSNNSMTIPVGSYTQSLPRRVLVEEFTTEQCPNCPRAINTLKQCEDAGYGERMTVVAHHVGFDTDFLTVEEDKENLWFFDPTEKSGTFAPAVMLDRTAPDGSEVPVQSIGYFSTFESTLQAAIEVPAFVDVDLVVPQVIGGSSIEANINIEKLPILDVCGKEQRLTVYVVESNIPMQHQAGITSDTFTHSHAFRKCVTGIWGDPIEWDGNNAYMTYTIDMDPSWDWSYVDVVAFVHSHDSTDATKCRVFNTAVFGATESTAVETVTADAVPVSVSYCTADGLPAASDARGVLIRTTVLSDGSVKTAKQFRP